MGAALSIVVLFTVTSTIVRVAGVVLEHSGIPRHIARLQAISALMGTGFTTSESELILQTPERRKILIVLMFTGGIGFGSLIATVVVGAFGVSGTTTGLLSQVAAVAIALLYLRYVLPRLGTIISGDNSAYKYLCNTIAHFMDREQLSQSMRDGGLQNVRSIPLTFGIVTVHVATVP